MTLTQNKLILYAIGIMIFTLGIVLTLQSGLGVSPFDALLVGLHRTIGLTIGSWEVILGALNAILLRSRPEYLGILTALMIGICIDFWVLALDGWVQPKTLAGQIACFSLGLVVNGFGIATYLQAKLASVPFDGTMLAVTKLTGLNVIISRALLFLVLVILAFIFNGLIGIGTLLITFLSGVTINVFIPYVGRFEKIQQEGETGTGSL
ncbi:YitT family protein [Virgibacillus byunsanensis]|uniref:YitT family protein n=1 Tax=Virgibacillus byunsanensis TaxID=570945 RepID=A0ABW3LG24_9BACI